MALDKNGILATARKAAKLVHIDEWGDDVYVRLITGLDRDELDYANVNFETNKVTKDSMIGARARACVIFLSDENGNRMFTGSNDWKQIGELFGPALDAIVDAGMEFNGMSKGSVEALEKNSEPESGDTGLD